MTRSRVFVAALAVLGVGAVIAAAAIALARLSESTQPAAAGPTPVLVYIADGYDPFPDFRFDAVPAVGERRVLFDLRDLGKGRFPEARQIAGIEVSTGPNGWVAIPFAWGPVDSESRSLLVIDLLQRRPSVELHLESGYAWSPDGRLGLFSPQGVRIVDLIDASTTEIRNDTAAADAWTVDGSGFWGHMRDRVGLAVFIDLDGRVAQRQVRPYSPTGQIRLAANGDRAGVWEEGDAAGQRLVAGPVQDHGGPLGIRDGWAEWPIPGPVDRADARWDTSGTGLWVAISGRESGLLHYARPDVGTGIASFAPGSTVEIAGLSLDDRQVVLRVSAEDGLRFFAVDTLTGGIRVLGARVAGIAEPAFAGFID